jgi:hypothetical protein
MSLAGRILYHAYHRPVGAIRDSIRAGGPFEQQRTEKGRKEMERAAADLPPLPVPAGGLLDVHLLTGRRFWYQSAFCLWSLARHAGAAVRPNVYDDGSLEAPQREALLRLFPNARVVGIAETRERLDRHLPARTFPVLRERWSNYPNIRKLTDVHVASTGWKLVIDSDLLFFRRPEFLLQWARNPQQPLRAVDCETSYGYSRQLLERLAGAPVDERVNVGLTGLKSETLDWERLERWVAALHAAEGTHYYLEQALVAMLLAGQPAAVAPAPDYVTLPRPPEAQACSAVMHHYVAHSKRWYFQHCWREALRRGTEAAPPA